MNSKTYKHPMKLKDGKCRYFFFGYEKKKMRFFGPVIIVCMPEELNKRMEMFKDSNLVPIELRGPENIIPMQKMITKLRKR